MLKGAELFPIEARRRVVERRVFDRRPHDTTIAVGDVEATVYNAIVNHGGSAPEYCCQDGLCVVGALFEEMGILPGEDRWSQRARLMSPMAYMALGHLKASGKLVMPPDLVGDREVDLALSILITVNDYGDFGRKDWLAQALLPEEEAAAYTVTEAGDDGAGY